MKEMIVPGDIITTWTGRLLFNMDELQRIHNEENNFSYAQIFHPLAYINAHKNMLVLGIVLHADVQRICVFVEDLVGWFEFNDKQGESLKIISKVLS